jgi:hypothetical protein
MSGKLSFLAPAICSSRYFWLERASGTMVPASPLILRKSFSFKRRDFRGINASFVTAKNPASSILGLRTIGCARNIDGCAINVQINNIMASFLIGPPFLFSFSV